MVKNLPAIQESQVQLLCWEDPLEKENGNPFQCSCLETPVDRWAWRATWGSRSQIWLSTHRKTDRQTDGGHIKKAQLSSGKFLELSAICFAVLWNRKLCSSLTGKLLQKILSLDIFSPRAKSFFFFLFNETYVCSTGKYSHLCTFEEKQKSWRVAKAVTGNFLPKEAQ